MFPIRIEGLVFKPNGHAVLNGVDLEIGGEGISVLLGPNGAGKSVLMRMMAGLLEGNGGSIRWGGADTPGQGTAMVFQHPMLLRSSVAWNAALGLMPLGLSREEVRQRTQKVLERVGLAHRAEDSARHLSGGERQRLALARAWAVKPRMLLLDEPTAALDPGATEAVEAIVREIRTEGTKIIMTTHNLAQGLRLADDIIFMEGGRVREHSPSSRFFARPQSSEARLFIQGELPWRIAFES